MRVVKQMNNVKKNFIYNITYQILILIIPLLTTPYLSRIIGVEGIGIYSYTYSIVYYFMLFTLLGVNNYGNRLIAKVRDDKEELTKTFWGIYLFQLFMGIILLILYIFYIFVFNNNYKEIAIIQILFLVSAILDINWFYFGMEEIKVTITRNILVKVGSLILIFLFVKHSNDVWKYTIIMSGMTVLSQLLLWGFVKKKVGFTKVNFQDIIKHIRPNLILFIPVIAISIYKMMDKIMLGVITDVSEVGFYENAEKIINIPLAFITPLGTVMLPRISNLVAKNNTEKINHYIHKSIVFVMFMSLGMCFGLMAIANDFAPFFFGESFQKTGILLILLAPTLLFLSFANVIRTQYLIPYEKDKIYIVSVFLGALMNLIMNFIFIPQYGSVGACFGTIAAEFIVMFYQALAVRKNLDIKKYIRDIYPFFLKAFLMFCVIYSIHYLELNTFVKLIIQIVLGNFIYGVLNIKYILTLFSLKKDSNSF